MYYYYTEMKLQQEQKAGKKTLNQLYKPLSAKFNTSNEQLIKFLCYVPAGN